MFFVRADLLLMSFERAVFEVIYSFEGAGDSYYWSIFFAAFDLYYWSLLSGRMNQSARGTGSFRLL